METIPPAASSAPSANEREARPRPDEVEQKAEIVLGEEQLAEGFAWSKERHERRAQGEWERTRVQLRELVSAVPSSSRRRRSTCAEP